MICVLFFPAGIWGTLISAGQAMTGIGRHRNEVILRTKGVGKVFGKFVALNNISAEFTERRDHLDHRPQRRRQEHLFQSAVRARFRRRAAAWNSRAGTSPALPQHRFAHMGVAKSFQITNVFPQLTTRENIRVGLQALVSRYDMWRPRARLRELAEQADELLALVGLWESPRAARQGARAWRAARARNRHGAGEPAAAVAAGRADRRHEPGRNPGHDGPDRQARRASGRSSWSSTR